MHFVLLVKFWKADVFQNVRRGLRFNRVAFDNENAWRGIYHGADVVRFKFIVERHEHEFVIGNDDFIFTGDFTASGDSGGVVIWHCHLFEPSQFFSQLFDSSAEFLPAFVF